MLSELLINEIAKRISDNYKPEKIILFGSYAYGNLKQGNDIDLFILDIINKGKMLYDRK